MQGEIAVSSGTTGPATLHRTAPVFSVTVSRRSFLLFTCALFRAASALFFNIDGVFFCATSQFLLLYWRGEKDSAGAAGRLRWEREHRHCAQDHPGDAKTIASAQHETDHLRGEKDSVSYSGS